MGELIILWFSVRIRVGPPRISGTASPRCGGAVFFCCRIVWQTPGGLESDIARHLQSSANTSRQTSTSACTLLESMCAARRPRRLSAAVRFVVRPVARSHHPRRFPWQRSRMIADDRFGIRVADDFHFQVGHGACLYRSRLMGLFLISYYWRLPSPSAFGALALSWGKRMRLFSHQLNLVSNRQRPP
jgi:hypothetical protein